ncbi:cation efflux family domain-containing protein [Trichoderma breve]|uniref:Cation efflux family domain-containing protein n=1 Tax=Trichoderma breve TaxID=2034170 RepID=A0A9W9EDL2_9HYPO|nr:cation efflux family domain-containing protein [Trichoderma breve]KAJ4864848.1 cation efflux family domain-containing protein [Trichoderma breve]
MAIRMNRKQRLTATIAISFSFFVAELIAGFYTHSLALIADAFHYLSDLIGFVVALVAVVVSEDPNPPPQKFTFGWARATLLGAFFNGVFLLALGVSILVQAIERFVNVTVIDQPKVILIVGCIGLGLNLLVLSFLHDHDHDHGDGHGHGHDHGHAHAHEHDHSSSHRHETLHEEDAANRIDDGTAPEAEARPTLASSGHHQHRHVSVSPSRPSRDLGMLGVMIHVVGDAINNIGVIASALIIWKAQGEARYYADPAIGIAPNEIEIDDIKHDINKVPGVESVHELHVWRLDQRKSIASAHVVVDGRTVRSFADTAKIIMECLHAYGIHSATLQPEVLPAHQQQQAQSSSVSPNSGTGTPTQRRRDNGADCQIVCGSQCGEMRCCTSVQLS